MGNSFGNDFLKGIPKDLSLDQVRFFFYANDWTTYRSQLIKGNVLEIKYMYDDEQGNAKKIPINISLFSDAGLKKRNLNSIQRKELLMRIKKVFASKKTEEA